MAESVPVLELDHHTQNAINQAVGWYNQEMARSVKRDASGGQAVTAAAVFPDLGAAISKYLPAIVQAVQIAAKGKPGIPAAADFFAEGHALLGASRPAPAAAEAEAEGQT
jgi:hypothetical protein